MLDNLTYGELGKYHELRKRKFGFLYLCSDCNRSFDSIKPRNNCKFCGGKIKLLKKESAIKKKAKIPARYRYYCVKCQKSFIINEKTDRCMLCGHSSIHFYPWRRAGIRDKLLMLLLHFGRMSKKQKMPYSMKKRKIKILGKEERDDKECEKEKINAANKNKILRRKKKLIEKLKFKLPNLYLFSRQKEELPSM